MSILLLEKLKRVAKHVWFRPRGANIEVNVMVRRPWLWFNRHKIRIGSDVSIGRESVFLPIVEYAGTYYDPSIIIHTGTYIGGYAQIHAMDRIEIGPECVLSEHVYISDMAHGMAVNPTPIMQQPLESKGPVILGKRVFVGFRASILPGVTLGDFCIVGSNAVVTQSFPAGAIVGGIPARLIKFRPGFGDEKSGTPC